MSLEPPSLVRSLDSEVKTLGAGRLGCLGSSTRTIENNFVISFCLELIPEVPAWLCEIKALRSLTSSYICTCIINSNY